jgi:hypothetical protein
MDYRTFEQGGYALGQPGYWWRETDSKDVGNAVVATARHVAEQQRFRSESNLRHARLYGNFDLTGFGPRQYSQARGGIQKNWISLNVVAACIDALVAKIGKSKPRPTFLTRGGDWKLQRKAAKLDKYIIGLFDEAKAHVHGVDVLKDACKFGTGIYFPYIDDFDSKVKVERVLPEELLIDDADGVHGTPRQALRRKALPREVLLELYAGPGVSDRSEKQSALRGAPRIDSEVGYQGAGDMVEVVEAWHLRSGPKAKDGRHVIAVPGMVLHQEEWLKPWLPFPVLRYTKRDCGFWGQGIAERLTGIQLEVNRLIQQITDILRFHTPKVLVPAEAKIAKGHIRGGSQSIGDIITYHGGQPPSVWSQSGAVPPEYFGQLDRLWQRAFEHEGISQLIATGEKPAGLNSGTAQREYNDTQSERHVVLGQQYEQLYVDAGRMMIELSKDIAKEKGGYRANAPLKRAIHPVEWKDINLEEEQYHMQAYPVSSLPTTPAARRQEVDEWVQRGWIPQEEAPRLMNMPDLENASSLLNAALDDVDAAIDDILDGGEAEAPDAVFDNLALRVSRGMAAYLRAKRQAAPEEVLEELRAFVLMTMDAIKAQEEAQAPPPMPQEGAPPPMPGAEPNAMAGMMDAPGMPVGMGGGPLQ